MTRKTLRRIHLLYAWGLGILILATGAGLVISCLTIYHSGESPFTRESILLHFRRVAPLVYATLIGTAGGGVLSFLLPRVDGDDTGRIASARGMLKYKKTFCDNVYFVRVARCVIAAAGIVFIVLGVLNGGMADVLGEAIRICTECIGLG